MHLMIYEKWYPKELCMNEVDEIYRKLNHILLTGVPNIRKQKKMWIVFDSAPKYSEISCHTTLRKKLIYVKWLDFVVGIRVTTDRENPFSNK